MDDNRTMAQLLEAPTEGYEDAIVVPEITANNFEIKHGLLNLVQNKQFFGHDKEVPTMLNQIISQDTFYDEVPERPKYVDKMPRECLKIIEEQGPKFVNHEAVNCFKVSRASTPAVSSDVAELKDMVRALILDKKNQTPAPVKVVEQSSGTLPGNTVTNPKEDLKGITTRSGVAYQGPAIPSTSSSSRKDDRDTDGDKELMLPTNNGSTEDVQPPVLKSHKRAIAWKLSNIKGINPEFCTHKILMEEDYEPTVQSQRRKPKIHDDIKKRLKKLLDAGD
ncbi:hypothetical protein Tco_0737186 [Tanacetum coccineum]